MFILLYRQNDGINLCVHITGFLQLPRLELEKNRVHVRFFKCFMCQCSQNMYIIVQRISPYTLQG